jgi:ankyrin repeat domain-containing protein 50
VFYFDFNDLAKQKAHEMLCSLICQLYSQIDHEISALGVLYERCSHFYKPGVHDLLEVLRELISNFNGVYIILDALDESTEREVLLPILEKIPRWGFKQLHMLITSRREPDIERSLDSLVTHSICIQGKLVDADIQLYIHDQLKQDAELSQWPGEVRAEIETTLVKGAHGMFVYTLCYKRSLSLTLTTIGFRWVVCQLEVLRKCLSLSIELVLAY